MFEEYSCSYRWKVYISLNRTYFCNNFSISSFAFWKLTSGQLKITLTILLSFEIISKVTIYSILSFKETPVFPLGIAALRRRNPGEKLVAGSILLKGHFWELLNRLLNFWYWSDEFEKQIRTRKVISTARNYLYPVHRTPTDDPIFGGGNGQGEGR